MSRIFLQTAGLFSVGLAAAACMPLRAQTGARTPLTGAVVATALAQAGLLVDATQIELPGSLSTTGSDTQLRINGVDLLPNGHLRVRLICRPAGACQPFLATVRSASATEELERFAMLQKALQVTAPSRSNTLVRLLAGQHATLLLEDHQMRITVPVLLIDSGASGTEVRVSSLDHKQIFRAVVTDAGTVRGTLP